KVLEIDLSDLRQRLDQNFQNSRFAGLGIANQFRKMLSSAWPTADIADLTAFNFLEDIALKQSLLAEPDVRRRVETIATALESLEQIASILHSADPSSN